MERDILIKIVNDELRSSNEVADELNITKQGVAKLVARGELRPVKTMPNASLFLESDIEKIKVRKKLISSINPQIIYGGSTGQFLSDFADIVRVDDVIGVYIYFYESEAAMDGFYSTREISKKDTLVRIDVPNFIVKYSDLSEVYFNGAMCGYGGTGPGGSHDILVRQLGVPEEMADEVYSARSIKFFREGMQWRYSSIDRDLKTNDDGYWNHQNLNYIYNNHFVKLVNATKRDLELSADDNEEKRNLAEEFEWFVPNPDSITIYPKSIAIETGHFTLSSTHQEVYPVVVRDKSGNELWLNVNVKEDVFLYQQERILDIIKAFGFEPRDNDKNKDRVSIIKPILDRIMRVDQPITFSKFLDLRS